MFLRQIPVIKLNINGVEEVVDPNEDLQIIDGDLNTEFAEQPRKFAFYGGMYAVIIFTNETKVILDTFIN